MYKFLYKFNPELVVFESMKDLMLATNLGIKGIYIPNVKETISKQKENTMKNISIRIENKFLVNYVYNKLKDNLKVGTVERATLSENAKHNLIRIDNNKLSVVHSAHRLVMTDSKEFIITSASNADTIIDEVVKEYNKPDYKEFNVGGGFNGNTISVKVFKTHVLFGEEKLSLYTVSNMINALLSNYGNYIIGGTSAILFTNKITGTKIYTNRDELTALLLEIENYG